MIKDMDDNHYLQMAITRSRQSVQEGRFAAGAVIVADYLGEPPTFGAVSGNGLSDFRHAETRAIEGAIEQVQRNLTGAVLYASMEPCLMCMTMIYWSGVRRVVYAIRQSKVDSSYYESDVITTADLARALHETIKLVHVPELEGIALDVVREWEQTKVQGA